MMKPKITVGLAVVAVVATALGVKVLAARPTSEASVRERIAALPKAQEAALLEQPLQPGDVAPDFNLPDQNGKMHRLSDLRGKTVVLSFYPLDFTYLCSSIAKDFSDDLPAFKIKGAVVFSVSVQSVASKERVAKAFDIKQPLLADPTRDATKAYRVLSKSGLAARVTFVIGPDGKIVSTDQNINPKTHVHDVLNSLGGSKSPAQPAQSPIQQARR